MDTTKCTAEDLSFKKTMFMMIIMFIHDYFNYQNSSIQ